jgi:lincosamide nucleotidyltransferase
VLVQQRLIERVGQLCRADGRLAAALTYGSFAQGEGDAYSDIEFWLFFDESAVATLDRYAWIAEVGEARHVVVNEFGAYVAFFPGSASVSGSVSVPGSAPVSGTVSGLVRGEFHFAGVADIDTVRTWPARGVDTNRMIVDRDGALRRALDSLPGHAPVPATAREIEELCGRFVNWLLLAHHVSRRGEIMRSLDALTHAQRHLLWMARLVSGSTRHWLTPSRAAEADLPPDLVAAGHETTATADTAAIDRAITAAWTHGRAWWLVLAGKTGRPVPAELFADLDACVLLTP